MKRAVRMLVVMVGLVAALEFAALARPSASDTQAFSDPTGEVRTFSRKGAIDVRNAFFQSLGTNGRSCGTCHQAGDAWTITPEHVQARFDLDGGLDPIFRTNDGSNSPLADISTVEARREAFSMLLSKGLIRVGIGIPDNAEFELIEVDDPYGYASASELSLFRRPLPSTNLDGGVNSGAMVDFATGWDNGLRNHGRPADAALSPDGRLFIASDASGEIFWIAPITAR